MAREIVRFKSEERTDRDRAAAFLRQLADKVQSGTVTMTQGSKNAEVEIPETLVLEVKVEEEDTTPVTLSLEVELEWREGEAGQLGGVQIA